MFPATKAWFFRLAFIRDVYLMVVNLLNSTSVDALLEYHQEKLGTDNLRTKLYLQLLLFVLIKII